MFAILPDYVIITTLGILAVVAIVIVVLVWRLAAGSYPSGALTAAQPAVYVTNLNNNTITIYFVNVRAGGDEQLSSPPSVTYHGAELDGPQAISLDPSGRACVANLGVARAPSVAIYGVDFSSATMQSQGRIMGDATVLEIPRGIGWRLHAGNIVVSNGTNAEISGALPAVLEYAATAGNNGPVGRIQGGRTGILMPWKIAVDSADRMYVPDPFTDALLVFATPPGRAVSDAAGWRIAGENTNLHRPVAAAIDVDGTIYVLNAGVTGSREPDVPAHAPSIAAYPSINTQARGHLDIAPLWTLEGAGIGPASYNQPSAIALDGRGRLYVTDIEPDLTLSTGPGSADSERGKLLVFALRPNQVPRFIQEISGPGSGIFGPSSVAAI